ncbi:MAG: lectin-like protein, partial [Methylovulum sp.]|nr:lectin-like protein [Methylovulum sp.]
MQKLSLPLLAVLSITAINSAQADSATLINPSNGHSYKRFDTAETWSQAKDACANQGGYLATITSQNENDWVWSKFGASTGVYEGVYKGFWLGGSDAATEGQWTWITGELWSYSNWDTGQPDNASGRGGQNYTVMWNYHVGGSWDDGGLPYSDPKTSYLCEWNSSPNDSLGEFIDLNTSTIDYINDTIVLTFTKPLSALSDPNSPRPPILSDYFDKIQLKIGKKILHTWQFKEIEAQLNERLLNNQGNYVILNLPDLKDYSDQLVELQFAFYPSKEVGWVLRASLQGVYDRVRNFAGNAILNARNVEQTKPTNNKICTNKQGIKTPCNNFFSSAESGLFQPTKNSMGIGYQAVFRSTLTHRLVDFDKVAPIGAINGAWSSSKYGKAPQNDNGRIPLLLIHGWQGDEGLRNPAKLGLWDNSELQYWRHFLDYYLATPDLQSKYHVYLYHYPSYKHVTYNANVLSNIFATLAAKKSSSDLNAAMQTGGKGVVVLAHSMGGLVTRSAIEEYGVFGDNAEKLRRLITLDTPHHGSPAANPGIAASFAGKDLYSQGSADIQWDNFDTLYDAKAVKKSKSIRQQDEINSEDFDKAYQKAYQNACARKACPELTQNPWLAWLNANFIPAMDTYSNKYLLYAGWMMSASSDEAVSGGIVNNGWMAASDTALSLGTWGIASGGAAPVHSALWYLFSPFDAKATPFSLTGLLNESPYYPTCSYKKPDWDANQWFGGASSTIKIEKSLEKVCGNAILISKSDTLSASNPNHPLGFQLRIFWDYDHETMVNGAYWGKGIWSKKAGGWDKYIEQDRYIALGRTTGDSGFIGAVKNELTLPKKTLARDVYIAKAFGYMLNNEAYTHNDSGSPSTYNPLKLEPLFNVLQGDLVREADSLALDSSWTHNPVTGHYYKVLDCGDWEQCEAQAVGIGAHLVTINDQAENDWVVNTFLGDDVLWIGYTDKDQEGTFKWVSGESS